MCNYFNVNDNVEVVGLRLPDNLHLNGHRTTIIEIISRQEAIRRLGFNDITEKGIQNSFFYVLDDFYMTLSYRSSFGVVGYKKINFVCYENLRLIQPKATESFDEMLANIKHKTPSLV